ncbi:AGE family epimerase/isomerase [Marivivens sp. LCG002]|uniref:AGE family epimerase/isomerase n=1 Tax=Marivivens sp. LCG002 TaxID=3051171 RepID=UPI00255768BF|nr:AGE family epimerase/isomerase [Marivivens sp. LCG002]WIV49680.1 AGE family epimerase/isomerase [Marivivens sp. LCG002]
MTISADRLLSHAHDLFRFFGAPSVNPKGGFYQLDGNGAPIIGGENGTLRELHETTRMAHCYALGTLMGIEGAREIMDHAMDFLLHGHRDTVNGGYFWGVDDSSPLRSDKQAYGHAFVLLAAASAGLAGHPEAKALHEDVMTVILARFWDESAGAMTEEYTADWQRLSDYRGQNSNMHSTEALMAAYETWGDARCLEMAVRISERVINTNARKAGWVVPEHFDQNWNVEPDFAGDPMFRPAGTTPGHALEWARLLVQLWHLTDRAHDWMKEAALALFETAVTQGWSEPRGGFHYTLEWDGTPAMRNRFWWPCCEGAAAASVLANLTQDQTIKDWEAKIWQVLETDFIDHAKGGWWPEVDENGAPRTTVFKGKPDIYHALQACLIPLFPQDKGIGPSIKASTA